MRKILVLADSCSLPRSFPKAFQAAYEKTYPHLLKQAFGNDIVATISIGGGTSTDLVGHALAYFSEWQPDVVIVQAGIVDCRPEPLPKFFRIFLQEFERLQRLKAFLYSPKVMRLLLRLSSSDNVSIAKFQRNLKKLRATFPGAQLFWIEIFTTSSGDYESSRPGIIQRIQKYNQALRSILKDRLIEVQDGINLVNGMNPDHIHLTAAGHRIVFEKIQERL